MVTHPPTSGLLYVVPYVVSFLQPEWALRQSAAGMQDGDRRGHLSGAMTTSAKGPLSSSRAHSEQHSAWRTPGSWQVASTRPWEAIVQALAPVVPIMAPFPPFSKYLFWAGFWSSDLSSCLRASALSRADGNSGVILFDITATAYWVSPMR